MKIVVMAIVSIVSTGCASQKNWYNENANFSKFKDDSAECTNRSNSTIGYRQAPTPTPVPIVAPTDYNAACTRFGNTVNCNAHANQSAQFIAQNNAMAADAGKQIGYGLGLMADEMGRNAVFTNCMAEKGYTQISKEENEIRLKIIQDKSATFKQEMKTLNDKRKARCGLSDLKDFYDKTACDVQDLTLGNLADKDYITDQQRAAIDRFEKYSAQDYRHIKDLVRNYVEPAWIKKNFIAFYDGQERRMTANILNLYEGKITWGEYNKKRQELHDKNRELWEMAIKN